MTPPWVWLSMKEFKKFRTEIFGFISIVLISFVFGGGGGGGVDLHVYFIPVCTWLTYNCYDYSAGYVFGIMKPDNHLLIVFVMVVF